MLRLQGMCPTEFTVAVTDAQLRKQLGNAMSVNVLERLLVRVLPAAGLVQHGVLVDRWENGEAVKRLTGTIGMGFKGTDNVSHSSETTEGVSNNCNSEIEVGGSRDKDTNCINDETTRVLGEAGNVMVEAFGIGANVSISTPLKT